ncbi:multidrug ABC transporter ATPase [Microbacterium halophytorum]|uniref:multidrug ABC transporter ATPase n=1 Tax=Microbacterium halophytorum TaxID=2067568 RepID=UPI000CFB91EF|nr:multidrug ABC transporter ATPase [Microbacterium halophytorum]
MSNKESAPEPPVRTIDRFLTFASLGTIVISVVCFFVILIASATGVSAEQFGEGAWPIVSWVPMIGLPVGFLMMLTLIVMTMIRKGRAARQS